MSTITITINNQQISCTEGESILNIARKEGIEIPAICYLSNCSPTMACKLCMVDIDGKRSYSCNTKAKEGMNILTHTPEIMQERNAIMQSYDVNHPLQCGVCDKSGECELQNYTLKMNVTTQNYHIKESDKPHKSWAKAVYDPNLCIMCERCATTCKDNLGEANLKAQKAALEPLDNALWKEVMPKDALSVWARKQKALIDFVGSTPCFDCGECISVCPVGALSTNDFKYKANAWELQKIESTCIHCPMGCKIAYEVRHNDSLGTPYIYRVKNDFYFNPICGAGRYGYDITSSAKPRQNLDAAIKALREAKSINIGDQTTNEEAFVLNHLAKTLGITLHNQNALAFKNFISHYLAHAQSSSLHHLDDLKDSQNLIFIGAAINHQVPTLRYKLNNKLKLTKGSQAIFMHPLHDSLIPSLSKSLTPISYHPDALGIAVGALALGVLETMSEGIPERIVEGLDSENEAASQAASLLAPLIAPILESKSISKKSIEKEVKKTITTTNEAGEEVSQEVVEKVQEEIEVLSFSALTQAGIDEGALEALSAALKATPLVVVGADLYTHAESATLAQILGILERCGFIKVLLIPPFANALGLAMICDLSPAPQSFCDVGYRASGKYVFESDFVSIEHYADSKNSESKHSESAPHFILPAINQLEGTYTSIDSRILPLKAALPFYGYDLSDIAREFGLKGEYLIDYTSLICGCEFDDFENAYLNDGSNMRGYRFKNLSAHSTKPSENSPLMLPSYTSYNTYALGSPSQFNAYTAKSANLQNKQGIYVSAAHLEELGLAEGTLITLQGAGEHKVSGAIYIDHTLQDSYFLVNPLLEGASELFALNAWAHVALLAPHISESKGASHE